MGGGLGSYRAPLYKRVKDEYVELIIYMHALRVIRCGISYITIC